MADMTTTPRAHFVGRERELEAFLAVVDAAATGDPGVVVVGGDAGVGKTRVLERVAETAAARGALVVTGHCIDLGDASLPYLPIVEALTELRDGVDAVDRVIAERPALGRLLDGALGDGIDDASARLQLLDGIAAVLAAAGSPGRPLLLVLEDAHWADSSSLDVLRFLVARMRRDHVAVLVSYRTDDLHRRHRLRPFLAKLLRSARVRREELAPFTGRELRDFAEALSPGMSDDTIERVHRRSEGNAYFAEELIAAGDTSALPWSLSDVLRSRIERLAPPVARLAAIASVAGRRVPESLLRDLAARDDTIRGAALADAVPFDGLVRAAVAAHILAVERDGLIAFRHALLAEVVYGDLLPGERSLLHRAYLDALIDSTAPGAAAARAHHALNAHDLRAAAIASRDAAVEATRILAPTEALRHRVEVLSLWDAVTDLASDLGEDHVDALLHAAAAATIAGDARRAVSFVRSAWEELPDGDSRRAFVAYTTARHLLAAERIVEALDTARSALAELPDGPSAERAWTHATVARAALNLDRDEEAALDAEEAIRVARAVDATDAEADALTTLAVLEVDDRERSALLLEDARRTARRAGDLATEMRSWYNLAANRYYGGLLDEAAAVADAGIDRAVSTGMGSTEYAVGLQEIAELVRYTRGDLTPDPGRTTSAPHSLLRGVLLYGAVARGDAALAGDSVATIRSRLVEAQADTQDATIHLTGGCTVDALTWAGRPADAAIVGHDLIALLKRTWDDYFLGTIWIAALTIAALADEAEAVRRRGGPTVSMEEEGAGLLAGAETTADRGRPRGGRLGPEGVAWLLRARAENARLARSSDEVERWEASIAAFDYGYRYEVARSRRRLSEALVDRGRPAEAARQAAAALALAREIGAAPLERTVRAFARRARLDVPGVRQETAGVLTPREEDVLGLLARGLTNKQIGDALFISAKTVSVHVSNVYAKLGVSSRAEAVSIAFDRGLLSADSTDR
jgi:DNA-binding CsgD family transcriptional regulator